MFSESGKIVRAEVRFSLSADSEVVLKLSLNLGDTVWQKYVLFILFRDRQRISLGNIEY